MRDLAVFALADLAAQQPEAVDLGLRRQHAHEQLLLRHFEAEDTGHALARQSVGRGVGRDVLADVQHETGLAHRRAGGDDDEVAGLEAACHLVEIGQVAADAGDVGLVLEQLLDLREALLHELPHRHEAGLHAVFGHREDGALGVVEDEIGVLVGLVGVGDDLVGRVDETAQRGLFLDDARVVFDVGGPRHTVDERGQVRRTAHFLDLARLRQLLAQGHEIDGAAPLGELHHPLEDAAVRIAEEGFRRDDGDGGVERLVVEQHRAEHRPFGVEVVRQGTLVRGDSGGFGHERRGSGPGFRGSAGLELYARLPAGARLDSVEKKTAGRVSARPP